MGNAHPKFIDLSFLLKGKKIHKFRIIPKCNGRYFVAQFVYEIKEEIVENLDKDPCLSLDLGLNNLVAAIYRNGSLFNYNLTFLCSINHYTKSLVFLRKFSNTIGFSGYQI